MTQAQWTVLGLIIVIVGLEALRNPAFKAWFKAIFTNFNTALNSASKR